MPNLSKSLLVVFILIISLLPLLSIFKPGFFPMHDDTQVVRVNQMAKALSQGQFPVRWVGDLGYGYGYPIFNFYNPLPYYIGGVFNLIGFDALSATKIMFILGFLLAGISMFYLARNFWGSLGGALSALFYVYAPYHAIQVYVRGSVAEIWAYGILPFLIWGIVKRKTILTGIFLSLLILAHNLTAMMVFPFIIFLFVIMILTTKKDKKLFFHCFAVSLLIGLSSSAFFWLPALVEKKYTAVDQMVKEKFNPLLNFVYPDQLWQSNWGWGGSAPGRADGMSFQIGKLHLILSLLSFIPLLYFRKKAKDTFTALALTLGFLAISIFMMLEISQSIWLIFSVFLFYLQFPWRFLTFAVFASSLIAGSIIYFLQKINNSKFLSFSSFILILLVLLYVNTKKFTPAYIYSAEADQLLAKEEVLWRVSGISDEYLPKDFPKPNNIEFIYQPKFSLESAGDLRQIQSNFTKFVIETKSTTNNILKANIANFPGWKVWIDNKPAVIDKASKIIILPVPSGNHQILIEFTNTPIRKIANLLSVFSLLFLAIYLIFTKDNIFL